MITSLQHRLAVVGLGLGLLVSNPLSATAADSTVRAVMFYSPTCPHCHTVAEQVLRPLIGLHGGRFQVVGINTSEPAGQRLYQAAIDRFQIPPQRRGVPTLVIGDRVLVGGGEIPAQLPALVETYLEHGGLDWPGIPGLAEALAPTNPQASATPAASETPEAPSPPPTTPPTATPDPDPSPGPTASPDLAGAPTLAAADTAPNSPAAAAATPTVPVLPNRTAHAEPDIPGLTLEKSTWQERFAQDPLGNGLAVGLLLVMVASVVCQVVLLSRGVPAPAPDRGNRAIPVLVVLGLLVAGYLAFVETLDVAAVCGPVGDCNAVQQSEYATMFGFLPMAVLGLLGYLLIGAAWAVSRRAGSPWAELAHLAMATAVWFGILFSIYLTYLEPFVIGATCAWCLASALVMTILLWIVTPLAPGALAALRERGSGSSQPR